MVRDHESVVMPRMVKIFRLRGLGYSQSEIATRISVSQQTVSYYLKLMKSKSQTIGPDKYFRSLLPYLSDKAPAIPAEVNELNKKFDQFSEEIMNELENERNNRNEEVSEATRMFTTINQTNIELFRVLETEIRNIAKRGFNTEGED